EREMVADEIRRVPCDHYSFAQTVIGECADLVHDVAVRLLSGDDLEEMKVPGRIEEVCAEPVMPEVVGAAFSEHVDWNARGVRADDRSSPSGLIDTSERGALDVKLLNDRFDDPVGLTEAHESLLETRRGNDLPGLGCKKRIRLEGARALQSICSGLVSHVEQQDRDAGVCDVRRDLSPHDTGAQHGYRANHETQS